MAITIRRGEGEDARREFYNYVHAYQCMGLNRLDDDVVTLWTFDDDSILVWQEMEYNAIVDYVTGDDAIAFMMAS